MNKNGKLSFTMNQKNIAKQKGFSLWGFIFVGGVIIFCVYVGALLVPVYSADSAIKAALTASLVGVTRDKVRKKEIVKVIDRRLYIDGIYNGPEIKESLDIKKDKKGTTVILAYKEQVPLFYNIGLYLDFKHEVEK